MTPDPIREAREAVDDACRGLIFCVGGIPREVRDGEMWRQFIAATKAERALVDARIKVLEEIRDLAAAVLAAEITENPRRGEIALALNFAIRADFNAALTPARPEKGERG